jgi:hypothetical protein
VRSDGKCEPHIHPARVSFDGCVEEFFDLCKRDDLVKLFFNFVPPHAENGAVEPDVLATRKLGVKARPYLQKAADATVELNTTSGWFSNT